MGDSPPVLQTNQDLFREILFNNDIEDRDDIYSLIYVRLLMGNGSDLNDFFIDRETQNIVNIERIKENTTLNRNTREQWSNKECGICLEEFKQNEYIRTLGCNHCYHKRCVDKWFKKNMSCPVCRTDV